ncbi:MAG TPA: type II secretion system F family protein, partial [Pirellulales bacterium]
VSAVSGLPTSMVPLVRWGEEHNTLPEALDTAADMFEKRVQIRAALLQSILPPIVFIIAALGMLWIIDALLLPLLGFVNALTTGLWWSKNRPATPLWWDDAVKYAALSVAVVIVVWLGIILLIGFRNSAFGTFLNRLAGGDAVKRRSLIWLFAKYIAWILTFVVLFVLMVGLTGGFDVLQRIVEQASGGTSGFYYGSRRPSGDLSIIIIIAGWGVLLWLATLLIALMVRIRYGKMERRALLSVLAVASEKGIPLPDAARAFADERFDALGVRAHHLSIALSQGLPLDKALAASGIELPTDALVAVRTGCSTGGLAPLLKSIARHSANVDATIQGLVGRFVYLLLFTFVTAFVILYIQIKIMPVFRAIFNNFHQQLPPVSLLMTKLFYSPLSFSPFMAFLICLFTVLLLVFIYTVARFLGMVRWDPPIVRRMALPLHESLVLRSLAESVAGEKRLDATLWAMAKSHPKKYIRQRLKYAAQRTAEGAHWCDALQSSGLVTSPDAAVLKAAERVGNLAWAMNNTADRLVRRFTTRMLATMSVGFPLVLLAFGAVVLLIAVGLIFPLAQLILHLA